MSTVAILRKGIQTSHLMDVEQFFEDVCSLYGKMMLVPGELQTRAISGQPEALFRLGHTRRLT